MKYRVIPVTPYQQNCSLVWCEQTMRGALIDPGGEAEHLLSEAEREGVTLERLLLTHGHLDHVGGAHEISDRLGIPIDGPQEADAFWLDSLPQQCAMFGWPPLEVFRPDRWLADGDTVTFGEQVLEVLHCPGHTPGHIVFFHREARTAFVGDVLFHGSIGRTDFPRGDYDTLIRAIRERLWPLGNDVAFIPGHGALSTFGAERRDNPFVAD